MAHHYRKKPVVIEARQWDGTREGAAELAAWMEEYDAVPTIQVDSSTTFQWGIATLEGIMAVSPDDWIIRGVKNEFYPCKPGIFEETYEEVEEDYADRS